MPCLIDLCKALWEVLNSYYKTINWHQQHDRDGYAEPVEGSCSVQRVFYLLFV